MQTPRSHSTCGAVKAIPQRSVPRSARARRQAHAAKTRRLNPNPQRGFTLLEVLLALGLGGVVIIAVGTAVYVHMHAFDAGRSDVEEAQLARALLTRIAADIRGAVPYDPVQADKLLPKTSTGQAVSTAASQAGVSTSDVSKAASQAGVDINASSGTSSDGTSSGDTGSSDSQNLASSTVVPTIPGIYGNSSILKVDVSRLPRLDQYDAFLVQTADSPQFDLLSDVKNVTYYVNTPAGPGAMGTSGNRDANSGLVRRELDRAVAAWANQQGGLDEMQADPPPMAPEVAEIAFRYFDGVNNLWVDEWYTDQNGGLPTAIEVAIAIIPAAAQRARTTSWLGGLSPQTSNCDQVHWYSIVVYLPGSAPGQGTASADVSQDSTDTSAQDSSGGSTPDSSSSSGGTSGGSTTGGSTSGGSKPGGTTPGGTGTGGTDPTKKGSSR